MRTTPGSALWTYGSVDCRFRACTAVWGNGAARFVCFGNPVRLSVLDLIPVRSDQTTRDALGVTVKLAQVADRLGFHRYWVAEHHNVPAIAATSPPVIIAYLAAQTAQIRLGSGGVMLPNHAPLAVAEQFALLEAFAPKRIDLGIGRAPGADVTTTIALRGGGGGPGEIEKFPLYVDELAALIRPAGIIAQTPRPHHMKATPAAVAGRPLWLLGSSMYSAHLAAAKGLPYVFAHHFASHGTVPLKHWRSIAPNSSRATSPASRRLS
jgi:luciferase family oxidoreductase group 1